MAEAQTLTYNPNEQAEGELNAEEKEALEVGEKLAEQQESLLAGKFKDAEELEQGYIELQKKLGEPKEEKAEPEQTEAKEEPKENTSTEFLDTLWEEAQGEYTQETLKQLEGMNARDIAQMHLNYRAQNQVQDSLTEENVTNLKKSVGGDDNYTQMMRWANTNLNETDIKMYDTVMERGDPLAAFFAVQALNARFRDSTGVEGELLTGKAPTEKGEVFQSQAQVVKAMDDPRYEKDPAYRQELYNKLERSKDLMF